MSWSLPRGLDTNTERQGGKGGKGGRRKGRVVGWRTEGAALLLIPLLTDGCYLAATGFIGCVNAAFTDVSSGRLRPQLQGGL